MSGAHKLRDIIRSLVRAALSADDGSRRVLYVGIADERPFTASDMRRLDGLGSALAMRLDNARLRAALRQAVRELQLERARRNVDTANVSDPR
jgi:GAF domain-containing protein